MAKSAIALIGPSGSGKSSIGRAIAAKLGWKFIDSDREIESKSGRTIAEIFRENGESEFRKQESLFLEELASTLQKTQAQIVLSTGGGMPIFADNVDKLEAMAFLVYLSAPVEVLVTRIKFGEERPLLGSAARSGEDETDLSEAKSRLGKLIAERESIYNRAQYRIDTSRADVDHLADDIIRLIGVVRS